MTLAELVAEYHDQLVARWRRRLRQHDADNVLQIFWLWLAMRPELVARVDSARNPLAYLDKMAGWQWRMLCRAEKRRSERQRAVARREADSFEPPSLDGFARGLTDAENACWLWLVSGVPLPKMSDANRWQLRHRIRKKLKRFLETGAVDRRGRRR